MRPPLFLFLTLLAACAPQGAEPPQAFPGVPGFYDATHVTGWVYAGTQGGAHIWRPESESAPADLAECMVVTRTEAGDPAAFHAQSRAMTADDYARLMLGEGMEVVAVEGLEATMAGPVAVRTAEVRARYPEGDFAMVILTAVSAGGVTEATCGGGVENFDARAPQIYGFLDSLILLAPAPADGDD